MKNPNCQFYCLLAVVLLFFSSTAKAQDIRGFHVNGFKSILGYPEKEKELLSFAAAFDFNYLLLYNTSFINKNLYDLSQVESAQVLANFIQKAKKQYGILQIGIVGEKAASFDWTDAYQELFAQHPDALPDVYHLEFEFWNESLIHEYYSFTYLEEGGFANNIDGAFDFYQQELEKLSYKSKEVEVLCETYIGNVSPKQCAVIGSICDRVMVHFYRKSDLYLNGNSLYQYRPERLPALVQSGKQLSVLPLFSADKKFMGSWILENPIEQAYDTFINAKNGYTDQHGAWQELLTIEGYQWYRYSDLFKYLNKAYPDKELVINDFFYEKSDLVETIPSEPAPFQTDLEAPQHFPNPAFQELQLDAQGGTIVRVEIYLPNGELYDFIEKKDLNNQRISVANWPEGRFWVKTFTERISEETQQVMVRRK